MLDEGFGASEAWRVMNELWRAAPASIASSSVFAADPTPTPSPGKSAVTETASPSASPSKKKTRRRTRVDARRNARKEPKATATPEKAAASPTPKK